MKVIFWKEIRENLKWAGLGFVVFSLMLAYGWSSTIDIYANARYELLLSSTISTGTMLCTVILAAALGFLQIVPEQRRDRWAFLVHRPVPWSTIFMGKASAGLALYFAATLPPWVILWHHASVQTQVGAPFDWRMGLGGVAQIIAATVFYFAGMVSALQQARWLGSKALALFGALWMYGTAIASVNFWAVCAWVTVMGLVLVISARGNFLRNGIVSSQSAISKACLILVLLPGMLMLMIGASEFIHAMVTPPWSPDDVSYRVNNAGEPVKVFSSEGRTVRKVEDADGNDMHLGREEIVQFFNDNPRLEDMQLSKVENRLPSYNYYYRYIAQGSDSASTAWYYPRGQRRLVAYDPLSSTPTGYLTPDGYHPSSDGVPASQFSDEFPAGPYSFYITYAMLDGKKLYLLDFIGLKVHVLADVENPGDVRGIGGTLPSRKIANYAEKFTIVAGLKDGIHFYDKKDGTEFFHVPYELDDTKWDSISTAAAGDNEHYMVFYEAGFDKEEKAGFTLPEEVFRYSKNGTLEKKWTLPTLSERMPPPRWKWHLWQASSAFALNVYDAGSVWYKKKRGDMSAAHDWDFRFTRHWEDTRMDWVVTAVTGLLCAALALWKTRPYELPAGEVAGWMAFAFFFGPAGLLVFLAMKEWPARVACGACGERRIVTREHCEHCRSAWEIPKRDGTEIFA